jgi:hypothetical protein
VGRDGGRATGGNAEAMSLDEVHPFAAAKSHLPWLNHRREMIAYWTFAAYGVAVVLLAQGQDAIWAAWAVPAYGVAAVMLSRSRTWGVAMLTAAFAVAVPLLVMLAQGPLAAGMTVIERSGTLILRHGTPYLPSWQLSSWLAYNPYLPAMALFGLPSAVGLQGAPGDPRVWLVLATVAALGAAFCTVVPHPATRCLACRRDVLRYTAFAAACPVMALNLAVTTTDPPVVALMLLSLGLAVRPDRTIASAAALGLACAMKPIAWLEIPVIAVMLRSRDGMWSAVRFVATSVGFLAAATVPALLASPSATFQNTMLFPLGLARHLTPAQSLTPGDLLARTGPAGHALAVGLLLAAGLALGVSLIVRPPRDLRAATWRLALGLALMFALGPAERFGYFIYPLGLAGWLALTRHARPAGAPPAQPLSAQPLSASAVTGAGCRHRQPVSECFSRRPPGG